MTFQQKANQAKVNRRNAIANNRNRKLRNVDALHKKSVLLAEENRALTDRNTLLEAKMQELQDTLDQTLQQMPNRAVYSETLSRRELGKIQMMGIMHIFKDLRFQKFLSPLVKMTVSHNLFFREVVRVLETSEDLIVAEFQGD